MKSKKPLVIKLEAFFVSIEFIIINIASITADTSIPFSNKYVLRFVHIFNSSWFKIILKISLR